METETEVWIEGGSSGEEDSQDENEIGIHDDDHANQVKVIPTPGSKRHVVAMRTESKPFCQPLSSDSHRKEKIASRERWSKKEESILKASRGNGLTPHERLKWN
jgi:hypothetical protein